MAITKSSKPASVDLNLPPPPVTARPVRREGKTRLMTEVHITLHIEDKYILVYFKHVMKQKMAKTATIVVTVIGPQLWN